MKTKEEKNAYAKKYYSENRESILKRAKKKYILKKKKKPKCKKCGEKLPKGVDPHTKYCDKCLYGKGHGADAHRMASVRWYRKNIKYKKTLDKTK